MPKVKKQTASKIGLFSAIMMIFGAVVGIGIFFKNNTVFRLNQGNSIGVLLSWIISIVIVLCMALSFAELSSVKLKNRNEGLGGWAQKLCGHKFGRFAKIGYTTIFYPVNTFAILFFLGEACLNCFADLGINNSAAGGFDFGKGTTAYVFLIGGAFFALFIMLNYAKSKAMNKFGNVVGMIKFAPIAMVIILGIIFGALYSQSGIWTGNPFFPEGVTPGYTYSDEINTMGMISSIPAILFAYEGYLVIGNIGADMEDPDRNVPLSVVLGVAIISVLYLAITIGCMTAGTGNVYHLMQIVASHNATAASVLTIIVSIFIFICLIGTINAMTFSGARAFQAVCEDGTLFKGKTLVDKKPGNKLFAGAIYFAIMVAFWWIVTIIPSSIANTDAIADGSSAVMVVALYLIYAVTVLGGFINWFTKKEETRRMKIFPYASVVAIIGSFFVFAFCGFYQFLAVPIQEGMANGWSAPYVGAGWGMFVAPADVATTALSYSEAIIWFWVMFAIMVGTPFLNDLGIKLGDKSNHQHLIWQRASKQEIASI